MLIAHKTDHGRQTCGAATADNVAENSVFGERQRTKAASQSQHQGVGALIAQRAVDLAEYDALVGALFGMERDGRGPLPVAAVGEIDGNATSLSDKVVDDVDVFESHAAFYLAVADVEQFYGFEDIVGEVAVELT